MKWFFVIVGVFLLFGTLNLFDITGEVVNSPPPQTFSNGICDGGTSIDPPLEGKGEEAIDTLGSKIY